MATERNNCHPRSQRHLRRFTLMEVVVAIGIFALTAAALAWYSSGTVKSWQQIVGKRVQLSEKIQLDEQLQPLFSQAIPFLWKDSSQIGSPSTPFIIATPDALRIASLHPLHSAEEGAIRFSEITLDEEGNLLLIWTDRPFLDWGEIPENRIHRMILSRNVAEIHFRYADWSSDTATPWEQRLFWRDAWESPSSDSEREDIPLAILLQLQWNNGETRTWLYRTTGVSYRERFGTWNPPAMNLP